MVPVSSTPIWCGVLVSDAELAPRLNAHGSSREKDIPRLALRGIRNYCGFGHPWGASKNEVLHINDFDTPTTRCPVVDRPSPPQPNQPQLDLIDQETDCGEPAGNDRGVRTSTVKARWAAQPRRGATGCSGVERQAGVSDHSDVGRPASGCPSHSPKTCPSDKSALNR
jgi:hypothetical protein